MVVKLEFYPTVTCFLQDCKEFRAHNPELQLSADQTISSMKKNSYKSPKTTSSVVASALPGEPCMVKSKEAAKVTADTTKAEEKARCGLDNNKTKTQSQVVGTYAHTEQVGSGGEAGSDSYVSNVHEVDSKVKEGVECESQGIVGDKLQGKCLETVQVGDRAREGQEMDKEEEKFFIKHELEDGRESIVNSEGKDGDEQQTNEETEHLPGPETATVFSDDGNGDKISSREGRKDHKNIKTRKEERIGRISFSTLNSEAYFSEQKYGDRKSVV